MTSPAPCHAHQGLARRRPRADPQGAAARVRARPPLRGRRRGRHGGRGGAPGRRPAPRRRHHGPAAARRQRPRRDAQRCASPAPRWASWCSPCTPATSSSSARSRPARSAFVPKDAPADEVVAAARHAAASPRAFTAADLAEAMKRRLTPSGPQLSPARERGAAPARRRPGRGPDRRSSTSASRPPRPTSPSSTRSSAPANRAQALMTALRLGLLEAPDAPKF